MTPTPLRSSGQRPAASPALSGPERAIGLGGLVWGMGLGLGDLLRVKGVGGGLVRVKRLGVLGVMGLGVLALVVGPAETTGAAGAGATPSAQGPPQFLPVEAEWCLEHPVGRGLPAPATRQPATASAAAASAAAAAAAAVAAAPSPAPADCIQLEVPRSVRQMALGLMERPPLGPLRGMWFRFDPPTPVSFWMHRVPQPLDLIYLRQGRVIAIDAAVPPCPRLPCPSYGPVEPADGVVELQAHEAQRLGIVVGSPAPLRWLQGRGAER